MSELQDKLVDMVESSWALRDKRPLWTRGTVPIYENIKKISVSEELMWEYAYKGAELGLKIYNTALYFHQSFLFGAAVSRLHPEWGLPIYHEFRTCWVTQAGKSRVSALVALETARMGEKVSIAGADANATQPIMQHVRTSLQIISDDVKASITEELTKIDRLNSALSRETISFPRSGGVVNCISLGNKYNELSQNKALGNDGGVIIDESAIIKDQVYVETGRRMLSSGDSQYLGFEISNPHQEGHFQTDMLYNGPDIVVSWMDIRTAIEEGRYKNKKVIYNNAIFKMDHKLKSYWLCDFPDGLTGFFGKEIPKATEEELVTKEGDIFFLGLDSAYKGADATVCSVLKLTDSGHLIIVDIINLKPAVWIDGQSSYDIVNDIIKIASHVDAKSITCDAGYGAHIIEPLTRQSTNAPWSVETFNFGGRIDPRLIEAKLASAIEAANPRAQLHLQMRSLLEAKVLKINPKYDLGEQMTAVRGEHVANGKVKIVEKKVLKAIIGKSPDELDAVMLGIYGASAYLSFVSVA